MEKKKKKKDKCPEVELLSQRVCACITWVSVEILGKSPEAFKLIIYHSLYPGHQRYLRVDFGGRIGSQMCLLEFISCFLKR
jgi:hypothetical protein